MNILVFTKNWLGDVIFETPALRAIKENFPDSHLIAITPRPCVPILEANPYVDEIIPFNDRKEEKGFAAKWRFIRKLRERKIDKAYLFHRAQKHAWIACLAGAKERIGYGTKWRSYLLTRAISEQEDLVHDVQYFLDLVRSDGLKASGDYSYEFYYLPEDERKAQTLLEKHGLTAGKLVAINPGANWAPKRWPIEYFAQLADRLIERYQVKVVFLGDRCDATIAERIMQKMKQKEGINLAGETSLLESAELIRHSLLTISNDSAIMHLASYFDKPVVALFGPTDPQKYGPWSVQSRFVKKVSDCPACKNSKISEHTCMQEITVEDVWETIKTLND